MTSPELTDRIAEAVALRQRGEDEAARDLLLHLLETHPDDAGVNLQCAFVHDRLGLEREAIDFYETAIEAGLTGEDLHDAWLGLGSTYRALGNYELALATLDRAVARFSTRDLEVFRAMALYNTGRAKEACQSLLRLLVASSSDESIRRYAGAITTYAEDLDRTWS